MQSWLKAQVCKRRRVFEEELSPQAQKAPYVYTVKIVTTERELITRAQVFLKSQDGVIDKLRANHKGLVRTLQSPVGGEVSLDGIDWFPIKNRGVFLVKIPHNHFLEVQALTEQICSR